MPKIFRGIVAGLIATIVLSAIMIMKQMMGLMPELNVIAMLTRMAGASTMVTGWILHFLIGAVAWGILFSMVNRILPGSNVMSGIYFSIGAWLLMVIMVMPMAGAGFFGLNLGVMAPVMTLVLHVIFGAVLGFSYRRLPDPATARP